MLEEVAVEKAPLPAIEETRRRLRGGLPLRHSRHVLEAPAARVAEPTICAQVLQAAGPTPF
jgi:hypothetical protein